LCRKAKTSITLFSAAGRRISSVGVEFGPALIALGAKVKLVSAKGAREVPVAQFFVTPKDGDTREIALRPE